MKKFLRMLSIAMALVMCFTMVFTTAVSAEGTTPAITLGDAKTALAGDTITIPVTLEGFAAAGIVGAEFNVDLGGLEYVGNDAVVDGEAVANYADGVVRYADVPGDVTDGEVAPYEDGTLFTITATIPADAETDATYTVTVSDVVAATSAEEKVEVTGGEVVITVGEDAPAETPVVPLSLGRNILARDKIGVRFMVVKSQLKTYDSYYVEVKSQHFVSSIEEKYKLTETTDIFEYADAADEDTNYVYFDYVGITAYELTLPIDVTIYCVNDDEVVAKSQTWNFSIASRLLATGMTTSSATLYMDMINYATEVQKFFADMYSETDLGKHTALPTDGYEAYFELATSDEEASLADAETVNSGVANNGATAMVGRGLQVAANNVLRYTIAPSTYDLSTLNLKVIYTDSYGNDLGVTAPVAEMETNGTYYYYSYDKVALYDTAVNVTAELYSGDTLLYTRVYNVESYIYEKVSDADFSPVGDALMKFTYSLRAVLFP